MPLYHFSEDPSIERFEPHIAKSSKIKDEASAWAIAWLLDRGADINALDEQCSTTPLGWAARYGAERLPAIEVLLERGAAIDEPVDEPWAQPIAWATRRGHVEVVERLKR